MMKKITAALLFSAFLFCLPISGEAEEVLTYREFLDAEVDSYITVETYVQDKFVYYSGGSSSGSSRRSSGSSSSGSSSSDADPYNAEDYDDPELFYDDNYLDFDSFEDAEVYWDDFQ